MLLIARLIWPVVALLILALIALLAVPTRPAHASDLALAPFATKAPAASPWFVYMGLETGGSVTQHSFDFTGTGTGTVQIGGALAGGILGFEYKNQFVMLRAEGDVDYDFGRGGTVCAGMGLACHIKNGVVVTERVDFGLPQAWLGGATPFVSGGSQQRQTTATVDTVGSVTPWQNAFLAGAGIDLPAGYLFSIGARWDHVWQAQAIGLGNAVLPAVANTGQSDVFKVNLKWRLN